MYLYSETGKLALAIPLAPREIEYGGLPLDWSPAERSGTKPLLLFKGMALATLSFSFLLTDKVDLYAPQTSQVATIKDIGRTQERIFVRYSGAEQGLWRITDLSVSSQLRDPVDNEITRAMVSITLTEASDPAPAVGPVSRPPPPQPPAPVARTYVVVRGDTLWGIAKRFYGQGGLWPRIFDANRGQIRDPHLIYPNQRLAIP
ncbi:MAG: LysM peptidoglycan-binding domain-containing protein [Pseudonocardia sp.]|nr:LysM peptidoglycan-binding domain-containing protein [Pseudonocardia sp.]